MSRIRFPLLPAELADCTSAPATAPVPRDNAVEADGRLRRGTTSVEVAAKVNWDVIVIGAGPAGALAARQLSQRGMRTLLVDKSLFPRTKVCGGCLNRDGVEALRVAGLGHFAMPPDAISIARFDVCCYGVHALLDLPQGAAISRRTFDARLVLAAIECGADFLPATLASIAHRPIPNPQRLVGLQTHDRAATARGRIILAADGLGQTSRRTIAPLHGGTAKSGRIGLGAVVPADSRIKVDPGTIQMAVTREGYVGMVRTPDDRITIAAAIDPAVLKSHSAAAAVERIVSESARHDGLTELLAAADWRGTSALTRLAPRVAVGNVLIVGDAAGYVEPFSGDGMTIALHSALAVEEIVTRHLSGTIGKGGTLRGLLQDESRLASEWTARHRKIVQGAQRRCRFLAVMLRHPIAARGAMRLVSACPIFAKPFLRQHFTGEAAGDPQRAKQGNAN